MECKKIMLNLSKYVQCIFLILLLASCTSNKAIKNLEREYRGLKNDQGLLTKRVEAINKSRKKDKQKIQELSALIIQLENTEKERNELNLRLTKRLAKLQEKLLSVQNEYHDKIELSKKQQDKINTKISKKLQSIKAHGKALSANDKKIYQVLEELSLHVDKKFQEVDNKFLEFAAKIAEVMVDISQIKKLILDNYKLGD
ncbi:hypothetical protein QUF74_05080 [Candidatus Halobeggiatoa sp. HSG11]|nr:hypothetical protein [Candidatus Halobeggiatoa sp. HSG11]